MSACPLCHQGLTPEQAKQIEETEKLMEIHIGTCHSVLNTLDRHTKLMTAANATSEGRAAFREWLTIGAKGLA